MIVDLFLVYQFIRRLATPFNKWDAYKTGVIDEKGKILVKKRERSSEQKKSWKLFDIMIANLKKMLSKLPGGSTKIASYAAALFLIKEYKVFTDESMLNEDMSEEALEESLLSFNELYSYYINESKDVKDLNEKFEHFLESKREDSDLEEEPANNVSGGNIAGMDGGHMSKASQKKWTSRNKSKKKKLRDVMGDIS